MTLLDQPSGKEVDLESLQPQAESVRQVLERAQSAFAYYFIPSLFKQIRNNKKPPRKTAWLDGLRGFAALLVIFLHHQGWGHYGLFGSTNLENAFGWDGNYYFIAFPIVRLLFSGGHLAVSCFFAISGYVLSLAPLSILLSGDMVKFNDNITSALFRRWLRLFLPVFATTFCWFTAWHMFGIRSSTPMSDDREPHYWMEVRKWFNEMASFSYFFCDIYMNKYNDHAWTIVLEMRGSIIIYTCLMAFSRSASSKRLLAECALIWYFMYMVDGWFCANFLIGMLLCEIDLLADKGELPRIFNWTKRLSTWFYVGLLTFGLFFGSVPVLKGGVDYLRTQPGWYNLSFLVPNAMHDHKHFFQMIATVCIMVCIPRLRYVKAFFDSSVCQYLGRVSFMVYLVHGPVLWSIGDRIYSAVGCQGRSQEFNNLNWRYTFILPSWGPFGLEVNYIVGHLANLAITFYLAELATKLIDDPSLQFSKWVFTHTKPETKPKEEQKPYLQ